MHASFFLSRCLSPVITGFLAVGVVASVWGQTPSLERVAKPPSLSPLSMSIGGRTLMSASSSNNGFGAKEYLSQWPGAYFETAFEGSELYFRVGTAHEILHVVLDARPPIILVDPAPGVYRLSGMAKSPHAVTVFVVTESQPAPNSFGGFAIPPGEKALQPATRSRQIEFIGDSHTVGYGNTSKKTTCTQDEVWATTDDSQAFGALTANYYHADYQVNAISGHGVVRNYNGSPGDPVPAAYPYTLLDKKQLYSDPAWRPQVIVIALGTNDFSTPLHPGEKWKTRDDLHADYEATYVRFIQQLRARNRDAYVILWATNLADGEIESEVKKVIAQVKAKGESRIDFIPFDHLAFTGCHFHPSLTDDKTISEGLAHVIDSHPNIWQGK